LPFSLNFSDHQVAITRTVDRPPEFDNLLGLHHDELRQRNFPMRRIVLPMLAVVFAVAVATVFLRAPSTRAHFAAEASAMMPIAEMHAKIDPAKLPVEDFEDQSLVFPTKQKD
jgi:hypothetical protein